jgi:hypothetical protein
MDKTTAESPPVRTVPAPPSPADWRAIQSSLLADAGGFDALAAQVIAQPGLPRLIADDYALALSRAYGDMARAARAAAYQAGLCAQDEPTAPVAS